MLVFDGVGVDFNIASITGDGACLFNNPSLALFGTEPFTYELRRHVVNHIVNNYDHIVCFISDSRTVTNMSQQSFKMLFNCILLLTPKAYHGYSAS